MTWTLAHPVRQKPTNFGDSPQAGTSSGYSRISSRPIRLTSTLRARSMICRATNELTSSDACVLILRHTCRAHPDGTGRDKSHAKGVWVIFCLRELEERVDF